jgi:hypothetical protein
LGLGEEVKETYLELFLNTYKWGGRVGACCLENLVKALAAVEAATQRTVMVKFLASLFKKARPDEIDKIVYTSFSAT